MALALAVWRREAPWLSIAIALSAALIRETAIPFLAMMAVFAVYSGRWREASTWIAAAGIWAVAYAGHTLVVNALARPNDLVSPGWHGMGGWPLFVGSMITTTPLSLFPSMVAGPLIMLGLLGWSSMRSVTGLQVSGWLLGMATMIMLFARPTNFYWAALPAPLLLAGIAFVPAALADLWTAARRPARPAAASVA